VTTSAPEPRRLLVGVIAAPSASPESALGRAARAWAIEKALEQRGTAEVPAAINVPVVDGWTILGDVIVAELARAGAVVEVWFEPGPGGRDRVLRRIAALPRLAVFGDPVAAAAARSAGSRVREWTEDGTPFEPAPADRGAVRAQGRVH
jgi:hypothetical protein